MAIFSRCLFTKLLKHIFHLKSATWGWFAPEIWPPNHDWSKWDFPIDGMICGIFPCTPRLGIFHGIFHDKRNHPSWWDSPGKPWLPGTASSSIQHLGDRLRQGSAPHTPGALLEKRRNAQRKRHEKGDGKASNLVDVLDVLHQLKTVLFPAIYKLSTILLVVQDFATIHSMEKT